MSRSLLICWIILLVGQLSYSASTGSTDGDQEMLGQILGLVKGMKSQLNSLEVKVASMDDEIQEIKNQTFSAIQTITHVKSQLASAMGTMENTFDGLNSEIQAMVEDMSGQEKEDITFQQATQISIESHRSGGGSMKRTIVCGLSHNIPEINIILLSILESDSPNDDLESYTELARIDVWTQQPVIGSHTLTTHVTGNINKDDDAKSYLTVFQNISSDPFLDRKTYRCDIQGFDSQGQPVTTSASVEDDGSYQIDEKQLMESLSDGVESNSRKLETIFEQISQCNDTSEVVLGKVEGLKTEVRGHLDVIYQSVEDYRINDTLQCNKNDVVVILDEIKSKLDALKSMDDKLENLFVVPFFPDSRFYYPLASHVYKNKLYLFSRTTEQFNINNANNVCKEYGGYLVEFNDEAEFSFISDILRWKSTHFYTGYRERGTEGKYLHVESGRELKFGKWYTNRPSRRGSHDDCVDILFGGFNDLPCAQKLRYICEVQYTF